VHAQNVDAHLSVALICYLGATGAETSLLLTALNSPHPILTTNGHYTCNSICMTLLWLHHNHKISIRYHKNVLGSSHQSVGRWRIFYVLCKTNILTKLIGYQQPTCLCVKMEFVIGTTSLSCELYSLSWSCLRSCGAGRIVYGKWCFDLHAQCCGTCMVITEFST